MCDQGRPEETPWGIRFFAGEVSDAYLQREKLQRGYTVVIWRGRHVAEPTELSAEEAAQYWLELLEAGRRLERVFEPVKVNYETLGNALPHLHTHVMPRYADDPKPGGRSRTRRASEAPSTTATCGTMWRRCAHERPGRFQSPRRARGSRAPSPGRPRRRSSAGPRSREAATR